MSEDKWPIRVIHLLGLLKHMYVGGPDYPAKCSVPFIYDSRIYQACTDLKDGQELEDKLWCATETDSDQVHNRLVH